MKNILKSIVLIVILLNVILLTSCSSGRGWSCKKRYVSVPMTKEYIKRHQTGQMPFDTLVINKTKVKI